MNPKIFISYAVKDNILFEITKIAQKLKSEFNADVWICENSKDPNWVDYMNKRIPQSDFFLLFCSPHSQNSSYVTAEWQLAFDVFKDDDTKIIPIFEKKDFVPSLIRKFNGIQFDFYNKDESINKLCQIIADRLQNIKVPIESVKESDEKSLAEDPKVNSLLTFLTSIEGLTNILLVDNHSGEPILGYLDAHLYMNTDMLAGFINSLTNSYPILMNGELDYAFLKGSNHMLLLRDIFFSLVLIFNPNTSIDLILKENFKVFKIVKEKIAEIWTSKTVFDGRTILHHFNELK